MEGHVKFLLQPHEVSGVAKHGGSGRFLRAMPGGPTGDHPPSQNSKGKAAGSGSYLRPMPGGPIGDKPPLRNGGKLQVCVNQPGTVGTTPSPNTPEGRGLEILKSVVYGGLAESVTSLGVVASTAGSGASTRNILVLGFANMVGGLIVLAQNLRELRHENAEQVSSLAASYREDRYRKLLGRRENFWLHTVLAVLSYILFGLIPPIVYGFSFRESNNRDFKLITVFSTSLVCIFLLSISKSYVQRPPKSYFKTVIYYASMAAASSGVSYVVGDLVGKLIRNFGWFDSVPKWNAGGMVPVVDGAWSRSGFASS